MEHPTHHKTCKVNVRKVVQAKPLTAPCRAQDTSADFFLVMVAATDVDVEALTENVVVRVVVVVVVMVRVPLE